MKAFCRSFLLCVLPGILPTGIADAADSLQTAAVQDAASAPAGQSPYAAVERGRDYRVWQRTVTRTNALGEMVSRPEQYTELGTGLHYSDGSQWRDTQEAFELVPGQAVALRGPHQLSLAANKGSIWARVAFDLGARSR